MEFKISKKLIYNEQNQALDFKKATDVPQDAKNWAKFSRDYSLSSVFMEKYSHQLNWNGISSYQNIDLEFALTHQDKFTHLLYFNTNLSEAFMLGYPNFINNADWTHILRNNKLSENFLRQIIPTLNKNQVGWVEISSCQVLTEDFMREFAENIEWISVCYDQTLSEDFMEEFVTKIDWNVVSYRQRMSEKFVIKHEKQINWSFFFNKNNSSDFLIYDFVKDFSAGFEKKMRKKYLA